MNGAYLEDNLNIGMPISYGLIESEPVTFLRDKDYLSNPEKELGERRAVNRQNRYVITVARTLLKASFQKLK